MNLTPFNIKADIEDSIFLAAMVIQGTTPSCKFVKASTLCALPAVAEKSHSAHKLCCATEPSQASDLHQLTSSFALAKINSISKT
jgi:hypothetical protein